MSKDKGSSLANENSEAEIVIYSTQPYYAIIRMDREQEIRKSPYPGNDHQTQNRKYILSYTRFIPEHKRFEDVAYLKLTTAFFTQPQVYY